MSAWRNRIDATNRDDSKPLLIQWKRIPNARIGTPKGIWVTELRFNSHAGSNPAALA